MSCAITNVLSYPSPVLASIAVVTLWIHFVTSRIFLANLHSAPPLERWDPADKDAKRLLILGHPKSGKGRNAEDVPRHQTVDVAEMVTTGNWKIPMRALERTRTRRNKNQPLLRFLDWVKSECNHTAQLRRLGKVIVHSYRNQLVAELTRERLLEELLDRGDAYYRALWSTCTADERLVLFQLARDGWANPMNELAIQQLLRRGLILRAPGLRLMNDSFRQFIHNSQQGDEVAVWEREGERSVWRSLKLVIFLLGGLTVAWLVYAQQQFFNAVIGYVTAIGAATGVVIKLISDVRGKASGKGDTGS